MELFPTEVLLAVDGSAEAKKAARAAAELCGETDSGLHVVYVAPLPNAPVTPETLVWYPDAIDRLEEIGERDGRPVLEEQVRQISASGGKVARAHLKVGRADTEIVALAEELGVGLVVVGNRGKGPLRRALLGSVSDSVARHAHCPVLVVRGTEGDDGPFPRGGKILAAVDGSVESDEAASVAGELAAATGAKLHLVYAPDIDPLVPYPGPYIDDDWRETLSRAKEKAQRFVEERASRLDGGAGAKPEAHLRPGSPEAEIARLAEDLGAGLVVVGNRGLGGIKRALLGSVSTGVARHAHCPVLVVRRPRIPARTSAKASARISGRA